MSEKQITVTSPLLPDLGVFNEMLKEIWASKWITNMGQFHTQLEKALCEYLKVPYREHFGYEVFYKDSWAFLIKVKSKFKLYYVIVTFF